MSATQGLTIAVVYGLLAFVAATPGAAVLAARAVRKARLAAVARRLTATGLLPVVPQVTELPIAGASVAGGPVVVPAQRRRVLAHTGA